MSDGPARRIVIIGSFTSLKAGGEAILPWQYFTRLRARGYDVHLVTHNRHSEELLEAAPDLAPRMHFSRGTASQRLILNLARVLPLNLRPIIAWPAAELLAAIGQRKLCRELVKSASSDAVVHVPAPVSPRAPSVIFRVGAPVIFGPMNGGMTYPTGFRGQIKKAEILSRFLARQVASTTNLFLPGKRRAALLLVANARTKKALPTSVKRVSVAELSENGVDPNVFPYVSHGGIHNRFAYVGRLVDWKRVDLLLVALANGPKHLRLEVCGGGPEEDSLRAMATELEISERVTFHGLVAQAECAAILEGCDALLLPSIYECGGAVVLEAMASGLPVVAVAWGGPADYVTNETGILIEPRGPSAVASAFTNAMVQIASDPKVVLQLGWAGSERVRRNYSWESKIDSVVTHYDSVVATRA